VTVLRVLALWFLISAVLCLVIGTLADRVGR
jgi:hypothetical protein